MSYAVDLARGPAPLVFERGGNPDGVAPAIVDDGGRPALRLAVRDGAYAAARFGDPERCQRCEMREPGPKLGAGTVSIHRFALRVPEDFPVRPLRFVAAQVKGNDGRSPVFALRVDRGRLYADWRLDCGIVEHHAPLAAALNRWTSVAIEIRPDRILFRVDDAPAATFHGPVPPVRFLKLGPYRDRDPGWGAAEAAVLFRDIARTLP